MKKILYIRRNPDRKADGTATYCNALFGMFADDADCKALPIENYPTWNIPLLKYIYKPKHLKEAIKAADIIHINGYTAFGTIQALIYSKLQHKEVVYIAHWHPFQFLSHPHLARTVFNVIFKPTIRYCAEKVVTINNEDTAYFSGFCKNVFQIRHWLTPTETTVGNTEKQTDMILFVGRIDDPVKNFQILWNLPFGKFDIHCVGRGETILRADMTQHTNISEEELTELYRKASLVVIPSKYEAFSYVALEAMSNGTPIVMSDRVRIADYLENQPGYSVFRFNDTEDFINKVNQTIGSKVDTEAINCIFSIDSIKDIYKKMYLCTIKEKS
ncbi:MAG: glycosyltransferase family 4 protein [Bacteroidaceae bacterium]|nr:glycosyltransferase family 4 protein [Bacteroidaceae bacterium]